MQSIRLLLCLGLAGALLPLGLASAQSGTGNLYRVTVKAEMVGMPFQMPATTTEVCGPKGQTSERMIPREDNCRVTDVRQVGNRTTFNMSCTGPNAMTGSGEIESLGPDAYRGSMRAKGSDGGESYEMKMSYEGKRIRDCDYATESPEAKGRAMMAQTCESLLKQPDPMAYQNFTGPDAMCAPQKKRYCDAMLAQSLKPAYILAAGQQAANFPAGTPTFWDAFAGCGVSRQAALAKTCPMAESSRDYAFIEAYCPDALARACASADPAKDPDFLVRSCPVQAKAFAARHCAGRDYTALLGSPYAAFCNRYSAGQLRDRSAAPGAAGGATAQAEPEPAKEEPPAEKPSWRDRLKRAKDAVIGD